MQKFVTHDPVAQGWFNLGKSSATAALSQWEDALVSTEEILSLMCDRMAGDFEALAPKMRRPYTSKDLVPRQALSAIQCERS